MYKCLTFFAVPPVRFLLLLFLSSCSNPKIQDQGSTYTSHAKLTPESVIMSDGYVLPMKTWLSKEQTSVVVLAIHGFNDYSNAFNSTARIFSDNLITTYAIDQRGFGETEQRGIWAGSATMQLDLFTTVKLLCEKHAGLPVFLLGESMGGAVILSAVHPLESTCVQGVILMAPAVWGWQVMPWWQTLPLRFFAHTLPDTTVTGEGLDIHPSDNIEMLRALGQDPLIIKETRFDTIYGLTNLMEVALINSKVLKMPALILYGEHDEIIPAESFCEMLTSLPASDTSRWRLVIYPNGYHMLSRDLQGEVVIRDVVTWIHNKKSVLPSGQEVRENLSQISSLSVCD